MNQFPLRRREVMIVAAVIVFLGVVLKSVFTPIRETRYKSSCQSNLKQLGLGLMQYARDWDEKFPLQAHWNEEIYPYTKSYALFSCSKFGSFYAMNKRASDVSMDTIDDLKVTPIFYDSSKQKPNGSDTGQSWPVPGLHQSGNNVAFADGHVEWLQQKPVFKVLTRPTPTPITSKTRAALNKTGGRR